MHLSSDIDDVDMMKALEYLEFPIWNPSALAYLETYKTIKDSGFVVVLEGHGSDEQLGGYPYMVEAATNDYLQYFNITQAWKIYCIARETSKLSLGQKKSKLRFFLRFVLMLFKNLVGVGVGIRSQTQIAFDYKILPIVLRVFDRLTMANSIESRAPFMDYRLVELHRVLPLKYLVSSIGSKAILRKILQRKGLNFILEDKEKMGFSVDIPKLFSNPRINAYIREILSEAQIIRPDKRNMQGCVEEKNLQKISWGNMELIWKNFSIAWLSRRYEKKNG
jgi:asparagine synthase (glutamine-hydrolysing)